MTAGKARGSVAERLRQLPSVDALLQSEIGRGLVAEYGHESTVRELRSALESVRQGISASMPAPSMEMVLTGARRSLSAQLAPTLRPVINATGVIIHTNLGRAPLSEAARDAAWAIAVGYSNLEYDLSAGQRGSRHDHAESLLCELTGAQGAMVVNNNAGAVLLALTALASNREVIISRGQLVEIGGGFRIPDVMRQSGARLVEVGTTNRTYAGDYEAAVSPQTVAIMRAHRSNFALSGFVHEPALGDLSGLAHRSGLLMLDDLGSGALLDTAPFGLAHEPTLQDSITAGVDLVCASTDKLLGGPQGGIILGRSDLIERLKRFPLTRALRVDKTTLAALQATLKSYLIGSALEEVPVWQMIALSLQDLQAKAEAWAATLQEHGIGAVVADGRSTVGGGSLPEQTLPTKALALQAPFVDALVRQLRAGTPPIVARIQEGMALFDPRTILPALAGRPDREEEFLKAVLTAWRVAAEDSTPG